MGLCLVMGTSWSRDPLGFQHARVDVGGPVGGGGLDGVVVAVLVVVEKGIVHIAREQGSSVAEERDRVRRMVRSHRSHRR